MKKLSWSHKLFLTLNQQIGSRPLLDKFMHLCGHELIYILIFIVALWATSDLFTRDPVLLNQFIKLLLTAGVGGLSLSWLIAIIFPHHRPIREFPKIVQMISPVGTWKSFPSDHTIAAFVLAEVTILMGIPLWFSIFLITLASLVAVGRVYVGVHYPRDIIGGMIIATIFSLASYWLLAVVTQPLYTILIDLMR